MMSAGALPAAPDEPALHAPRPNPFIPADFTLRSPLETASDTLAALRRWRVDVPCHASDLPALPLDAAEAVAEDTGRGEGPAFPEPALVLDEAGLRVWHRHDNRFQLPKSYLEVRVQHPAAVAVGQAHRDAACMRLYFAVLAEVNRPITYDANAAGLSGDIDCSTEDGNAVVVRASGYHDAVPALARALAGTIRLPGVTPEVERAFERVHDATLRGLANRAQAQARTRAEMAASKLLRSHAQSDDDQLAIYKSITAADVVSWGSRVLSPRSLAAGRITATVYGNITAEEGVALVRDVAALIRSPPAVDAADDGAVEVGSVDAALGAFPYTTAASVPLGRTLVLTEQHPNPQERNSAVHMVWQVGAGTVRNRAVTSLLAAIVSHYAFDALRTKQQLGYVVSSGEGGGAACLYLYLTVQSNTASVAYLQQRMDAFIADFADALSGMPTRELDERKAALRARLLEPHKTPGSEFGWLNGRVMSDPSPTGSLTPDFHRTTAIAAAVASLSLHDVAAVYRHVFCSATSARVVSRVYAQPQAAATPAVSGAGGEGGAGATAAGAPVVQHDGGPTTVPPPLPLLWDGGDGATTVSVTAADAPDWLITWQAAVDARLHGLAWLPGLHQLARTPGWRAPVARRD